MNILVTGGGLLGSYTAGELLRRGHEVLLFDCCDVNQYAWAVTGREVALARGDVRDVGALIGVAREFAPAVIAHTAGVLRPGFARDRFAAFTTNTQGAICAAEAASRCGSSRLVLCSSLAVYDFSASASEITEEHPFGPVSLYDHSKVLAEALLRPYCEAVGLQRVVLRFAGIIGPLPPQGGGWLGREIQDLVLAARAGEFVRLEEQQFGLRNDYLFVKDAANALATACEADLEQDAVFNVGPGRLTSIRELAGALKVVFPGANAEVIPVDPNLLAPFLRRTAPLSISRAACCLGYRPRFGTIEDLLIDYDVESRRIEQALVGWQAED